MSETHAATDDYERALLGAVLSNTPALPDLDRALEGLDFYNPMHELIFTAATAVHRTGMRVTALSVADKLGNDLPKVGGAPYLHTLVASYAADDPLYLAEKVREARIRRDVANMARNLAQIEHDQDMEPERVLGLVREWADNIGISHQDRATGIGDALEQVIDTAERGEVRGTQMPWRCLDDLVDGIHPGQVITFAAASGAGKSLALENLATHVARSGVWVLMVSLEMSPKEITQRTLAHTARVKLSNIRRGQEWLSEQEWAAISRASETIRETRMLFAEQSSHTVESIRAAAWDASRHAKRLGEKLGMIVVDYTQLVVPTDSKGMSRQQQLGVVSPQAQVPRPRDERPVGHRFTTEPP